MRLAVVQANVAYGQPWANVDRIEADLRRLSSEGVDLAVYPEAFLTGYCAGSREEARQIAVPIAYQTRPAWLLAEGIPRDPASDCWDRIHGVVETTRVGLVVGYIGRSESALVNAATMWLPGQEPVTYRKSHLPHLGVDRFVSPGGYLPIFETKWGKIGILICYDLRIPEPMRVLALQGAELIILPTNWPGTNQAADYFTVVRAAENKVFLAACDRVGEEKGFRFIGLSGIYGPSGECLAKAGTGEEVLIADLDLSLARDKRNVYIPGEYELDLWGCRQPDLYGIVGKPQ